MSEVVVTGSRIRTPGLTSTSPLTVVNSQQFTDIGATTVESVLNELPSVVASQNSSQSQLSNGTATVNLRGLGANRTLVLVDGKRLMPGDPTAPVADLNVIPVALVDRVEVITGGASAVYGSDAVAGVVNFVMKKNFQGAMLTATENFASHDNDDASMRSLVQASGFSVPPGGEQVHDLGQDVTAVLGVNAPDGRGNVTAYANYRHLQPILESQYDATACVINASQGSSALSSIYAGHTCGGSSNSAYGKFVPTLASEALGGSALQLHDNPNGSQSFVTSSVPPFNYGASDYLQRSETRYTAGYFAHYEASRALDLYSDLMFSDDRTAAQIGQSGFFAGNGINGGSTFSINCNNPLMTATQQAQLCGQAAGTATQVPYQIGYRFVDYPRQFQFRHTDYKIDVGAKGELGNAWNYDAYVQYGTSQLTYDYVNDLSNRSLQNALLVDPATGQCYVGGSCVPLNLYKLNGVTQDAFDYAKVEAQAQGDTIEQVASASITGDLGHYGVKSPFSASGVAVAFGAEYRRESLNYNPDQEYIDRDIQGANYLQSADGSFDVYELFGEVRAPLVEDKPFVKRLSFDGGYRFSSYSTAGNTNTYKAQIVYAPSADIQFRGGYNRAVRAPSVIDLFTPTSTGNGFAGSDPCVGATPSASLAACVATGLPAALYGKFSSDNNCPSGCSNLTGGNINLKPEKSDTFTGGVVLTPTVSWARGFTLSIDYFNIKINGLITSIPPSVFVNECVAGDLAVCSSSFHRDPTTFVIYGNNGYILSPLTNSGFLRTDGVDVDGKYRKSLSDLGLPDWGSVTLSTVLTYTNSYVDQPVSGGPTYDCAGLYGLTCATPLPKVKAQTRLTYASSKLPVTVSAQWRFVGPVHLDANTDQPLLTSHPYGVTDLIDNRIPSFSYLDLTVSWKIRHGLTLVVGCNNVLDTDPPIVDAGSFAGSGMTSGNTNTYPGTYDVLGRTAFATLTADF
ncbi:TonB-dependent siderophore receptor [Caulobacter sp. S45]|uniref:TonB-dependent receptor plug domain-containing protein n=1 Tax=Caulobacter sp. S45 TaxID=1641861 RepID=UPI0015776BA9|nr:TonB-dependent receptor [Caulobacter sp. S45]